MSVFIPILAIAGGVYFVSVALPWVADLELGRFSKYNYFCNYYSPWARLTLRPWRDLGGADHCWHTTPTYPRCCHCGKGHPNYKPKKTNQPKHGNKIMEFK